jgi:hypothetical protein
MLPKEYINGKKYIKSRFIAYHEGIIKDFKKYGVVVIRDVINNKECDMSINALWQHPELVSRGVNKYNPDTWKRCWHRDGK